MKKSFFYVAALMLGLAFTATSCSNDDDNEVSAADIDYNSENATSWHNYMKNVGRLQQTFRQPGQQADMETLLSTITVNSQLPRPVYSKSSKVVLILPVK